jgi:carboxypeptidase PM20D1
MKWVKRAFLGLLIVLVLLAGIVIIRTALIRPAPQSAAPIELAPVPAIDVDLAAAHLSEAIRIRTISRTEGVVEAPETFMALHSFLQAAYPRVHSAFQREVVAGYSLLYTIAGSDPSLPPVLLQAHQDVVPVEAGTEKDWEAPPFAGEVRDGYIYGRGATDDKGSLIAIMESMEALLANGFQPRRSIILAFGHDEEVLGSGARAIAELLGKRTVRPWFVLDEGMAVLLDSPLTGKPAALIGIAEKGYLTVRLTARTEGGHSAIPPKETAAERLSRAILTIRSHPFPAHLDEGPIPNMLDALNPSLGFAQRAVLGNRWLFGSLISSLMERTPSGNALLRTTIAPTELSGGTKENVLPQEVQATVNLRLHPRDSVESAMEHLRNAVGGINSIRIEILGTPTEPSPISSTASDSYALLSAVASAHAPEGTPVAPMLVLGATDSRFFATIAPTWGSQSESTRVHGTGERLSLENLGRMVRFFAQLVATAAR